MWVPTSMTNPDTEMDPSCPINQYSYSQKKKKKNGAGGPTICLKDKVDLERIVLPVDAVLAGRVEVELRQARRDTLVGEGPVGKDLDRGPEVGELGPVRGGRDPDRGRFAAGRRPSAGRRGQVDGRLAGALGAQLVLLLVEAEPVQRARDPVVPERRGRDRVGSREQGRAVVLVGGRGPGQGEHQ